MSLKFQNPIKMWVITGSRSGHPHTGTILSHLLELLGTPDLVVLGDATGVDARAKMWCTLRKVPFKVLKADWSKGKRGGHDRNTVMLDEAGSENVLVIGFPDVSGDSPGTYNCLGQAKERGLSRLVVDKYGKYKIYP